MLTKDQCKFYILKLTKLGIKVQSSMSTYQRSALHKCCALIKVDTGIYREFSLLSHSESDILNGALETTEDE